APSAPPSSGGRPLSRSRGGTNAPPPRAASPALASSRATCRCGARGAASHPAASPAPALRPDPGPVPGRPPSPCCPPCSEGVPPRAWSSSESSASPHAPVGSEGDVVVQLIRRIPRHRSRTLPVRCAATGTAVAAALPLTATAQKLELVHDDVGEVLLDAFLVGELVVPDAALDVELAAL